MTTPRTIKQRAPDSLGARLTEARMAARWTQEQVAGRLGWRRNEISGYETGGIVPRADRLVALADLYAVTLDWLMGRDFVVPAVHAEEQGDL